MVLKSLLLVIYIFIFTACSVDKASQNTEPLPPGENPPVLGAVSSQSVEEESPLSFTISAISPDGSTIDYRLDNPPAGSSINQVTGEFSWVPTGAQSGIYTLVFRALSSGGVDSMNVVVNVSDKATSAPPVSNIVSLDTTIFTEGDIKEKIFRLSINSSKAINYIGVVNFNNAFTILDNMDGEGIDVNTLNTSSIINFSNNPTSSTYYTELKGAVKQAGSYSIQFNIVYTDATISSETKNITVNSSLLPTFRYDIINSLEAGAIGVPISKVYNQVKLTHEVLKASLTPILDKYIEKSIPCNGSDLENFVYESGDTNGHQACVEAQVSPTSETVVMFSGVSTSGSGGVGGLSLDIRKGALVSRSSFNHTLIHELGHNLGLLHTFETYANANAQHSGQNNILYDNGIGRRLVYSYDSVMFPFEYGDGVADTPLDPFGSIYVNNLYGGGGFFTAFNGAYEGEEHLLNKGVQSISTYFRASEYMCRQIYLEGSYNFDCHNDNYIFDDSVINNIMSYWYKIPGEEHLTPGQISKMILVINDYPEIK